MRDSERKRSSLYEIRWKNFRCFKDTGWIELSPITAVIGANASGKTSLIAPLLILKQTMESADPTLALKTQGDLFNAGSYQNLIYAHLLTESLGFGIRQKPFIPEKKKEQGKVGTYAPVDIECEFCCGDAETSPILNRFTAKDVYERLMLERTHLSKGQYSVKGPEMPSKESDMFSAVAASKPEHFYFDVNTVFMEQFKKAERQERISAKKVKKKLISLKIDSAVQSYLSIASFTTSLIQGLLGAIAYIGPIRERPKRLYEVSGERPAAVGIRGQNAPEILYRETSPQFIEQVNKWVSAFEFGFKIACNSLTEGAYNITIQRTKESPHINIADTGFGLSQVLPLIVQGLYSKKKSLLIAEQPEIHLNPRLQAVLADLFCNIASRGVRVLVETHSEHLILRLRRLVAEGNIKPEDVSLYYAEKSGDTSIVRRIPMLSDGHIEPSEWPRGFFEDAVSESLALASAQSKKAP